VCGVRRQRVAGLGRGGGGVGLLLWPGGVAERLCRLLQRACNAIFLGL